MIDTTDQPDAAMIEAAAGLWAEAEARRVGATVDSPYVEEQRRGFIDNMARADAWLTVALDGGAVVGAVGGFVSEDAEAANAIDVGYVVVAEGRRGQGIGRLIMACAVLRARALGAASLVLTVHEMNTRARQVYEAAGWAPTDRTELTADRQEVLLEYQRRSADPS
ncbi:MAG: GNAT family N-acetyltransferase [Microthrixaceae bacterium]